MRNRKDTYSDIYDALRAPQDETLPDALQPEAVEALVRDKAMRKKQRHTGRIVAAAAGFAVLLLAGVFAARLLYSPSVVEAPLETAGGGSKTGDAYLQSIASYAEIETYFLNLQKVTLSDRLSGAVADIFNGGTKDSTAELAGDAAIGTDLGSTGTAHGTTNTQVQNVDESDILKNDGEYLYIAHNAADGAYVEVVDIRTPSALKTAARIAVQDEAHPNRMVQELYLTSDTLVVLCGEYVDRVTNGEEILLYDTVSPYGMMQKTAVLVYDIADRSAPSLRYSYGVDGGTVSTRMTGGTLLLVTQYSVPLYDNKTDLKNACVPCYYTGEEKYRFPASGIYRAADSTDSAYLTVTLLDTAVSSPEPKTAAVLGAGSEIYCSEDALLIAGMDYTSAVSVSGDAASGNASTSFTPALAGTRLYAFQIHGEPVYLGSARVDGTLLDQFSMDEFEGFYRIATTTPDGCIVSVLDKNLQPVGEKRGIAPGESIYACRFSGDTAYLVTYYQTDPLFVLDLSEPESPEITGELKIPGFSDYLHPYSDAYVIGIGQAGTDEGAVQRLKISLFDVSDPQNPREADGLVFGLPGYSYSVLQYEHKAYLAFDDGSFAVPVVEYNVGGSITCSLYRITVKDGKLVTLNVYVAENAREEILRGTYAGETVFTLTNNQLTAYDLNSASVLSVLPLS